MTVKVRQPVLTGNLRALSEQATKPRIWGIFKSIRKAIIKKNHKEKQLGSEAVAWTYSAKRSS